MNTDELKQLWWELHEQQEQARQAEDWERLAAVALKMHEVATGVAVDLKLEGRKP